MRAAAGFTGAAAGAAALAAAFCIAGGAAAGSAGAISTWAAKGAASGASTLPDRTPLGWLLSLSSGAAAASEAAACGAHCRRVLATECLTHGCMRPCDEHTVGILALVGMGGATVASQLRQTG